MYVLLGTAEKLGTISFDSRDPERTSLSHQMD